MSGVVYMQSTGMFDKNGKEIYEDDIVRHNDQKWVRPVEFYDGAFWPVAGSVDDGYGPSDWEVIGNFHENPELRKNLKWGF